VCSRVIAATPSHRAASAAKGKGSAGPVRRRRENGPLYNMGGKRPARPATDLIKQVYRVTVMPICINM